MIRTQPERARTVASKLEVREPDNAGTAFATGTTNQTYFAWELTSLGTREQIDTERVEHAAVPTLRFALEISSVVPVRSVLLDVQLQIAARRRGYDAAAKPTPMLNGEAIDLPAIILLCPHGEERFVLSEVADTLGKALTNVHLAKGEKDIFTDANRAWVAQICREIAANLRELGRKQ